MDTLNNIIIFWLLINILGFATCKANDGKEMQNCKGNIMQVIL